GWKAGGGKGADEAKAEGAVSFARPGSSFAIISVCAIWMNRQTWKNCAPAICRGRALQLASLMPASRGHRLRLQRLKVEAIDFNRPQCAWPHLHRAVRVNRPCLFLVGSFATAAHPRFLPCSS